VTTPRNPNRNKLGPIPINQKLKASNEKKNVKLKKKDKTNDSSKPRTVARAMLRFEPVFLKKKKKFKILVIDLNGSISHTKITMNDKIKKTRDNLCHFKN
jgi:ClpP class serine protease